MAYANGAIPLTALVQVQPGLYLTPSAAESWLRIVVGVRAQSGWTPRLTDAYRALDGYYGQEAIFLRRYIRQSTGGGYYGDVRWWNGIRYLRRQGQAAAAVPGTSNHGNATAVDVGDLGAFGSQRFNEFAAAATRNGWSIAEGRSVGEPWHWTKNSTSFASNPGQSVGIAPTVPTIPTIDLIEEDEMSAAGEATIIAGVNGLAATLTNIEGILARGDDGAGGIRSDVHRVGEKVDKDIGFTASAADEIRAARVQLSQLAAQVGGLNIPGTSPVDVHSLAAQLADALDDELAAAVVDLLRARLAS